MQDEPTPSARVEYGVAIAPFPGQTESGDQYLVKPFQGGALVAVVDGLGHGPKAAQAAKTAVALLEPHAHEPPAALFERCHRELVKTRGAAISLASVDALRGTITWIGVGNVTGLLLRANGGGSPPREQLLVRGGIVGFRLPPLRAVTTPVAPGDTLILVTDGVRSSFSEGLAFDCSPQQIADDILARHYRGNDDALALVARYAGPLAG